MFVGYLYLCLLCAEPGQLVAILGMLERICTISHHWSTGTL